jgi:hypothetical protein
MAVTAVSPVKIRYAPECFYSGVDMFNHNTPLRKPPVIRLLLLVSLWFLLDFTGMKLFV